MGYVAKPFVLRRGDRQILESWLRSPNMPQAWVLRAKIVLAAAKSEGVRETARRLGTTPATVVRWRQRYGIGGIDGLRGQRKGGRPRQITDALERRIVAKTVKPPKPETQWSARTLAREIGVSAASVHRIWKKHGLQPHRVKTFKFSTDPAFEQKMADIVGLYLDPPEKALVLCVDEKSQIQALDRTQPILPLRPNLPARMTHDYTRHGTTSLFAALEVASGKVHGRCFPQHTHVEFVSFLDSIHRQFPDGEIHLICDNYGTHKHQAVLNWLRDHPRFTFHFTPTSASWLNMVEAWFSVITRRAIRRGSFNSVKSLERTIAKFIAGWNQNAAPFRWTKSVPEIKRKLRHVIANSETEH